MLCTECGSKDHADYRTCPKWNTERAREHFDKYEAIAQGIGVEKLKVLVPAARESIVEALKTDRALNNIPLRKWDGQHANVLHLVRATKQARGWSLSDTVCTLKHVARHHVAGEARP